MLPVKLLSPLLLFSFFSFCQKNITGLINAEKAFAQYALDSNTRDAFVKFLDSNCVVFNEGKAINGYQLWKSREKRTSKIIWAPEFAAIASSNEYGVTTGPYEFKASVNDTALARGNFTSIWHYNTNKEWKNVLDFGISYTEKRNPVTEIKSYEIIAGIKTDVNLVTIEKAFIFDYNTNGVAAYKKIAADNIWFNTEGQLPVNGINSIEEALKKIPPAIQFIPSGMGVSYSKDFGYIYGTARLNDKQQNYLRVWIKENGEWKLLLQTLGLSN
ncbi:MAG: nuclear transport factor 2 family protein [Sphingobacteriales bacterium]|nr:nuclear transport factor 2 family protein [Sphingobacteriales bacterium]